MYLRNLSELPRRDNFKTSDSIVKTQNASSVQKRERKREEKIGREGRREGKRVLFKTHPRSRGNSEEAGKEVEEEEEEEDPSLLLFMFKGDLTFLAEATDEGSHTSLKKRRLKMDGFQSFFFYCKHRLRP